MFAGRVAEREDLTTRLGERTPSLTVVRGAPGIGVTRFLREVVAPLPHLFLPIPHLPDEGTRALLAQELQRVRGAVGRGPSSPPAGIAGTMPPSVPDWPGLLALATGLAPPPAPDMGAPFTLILDDAHRLADARAAVPSLLRRFMEELTSRPIPFHVILAGTDPVGMEALAGRDGPSGVDPSLDLQLPPLTPSESASFFPRWSAAECLTGWAVLGGHPHRLSLVERRSTLATTVQRLILDPDGPLHEEGNAILERAFQAPARYGAVLAALAGGARSWGDMAGMVPEELRGARLGPYVKALDQQGLIRTEVALDARDGSRARRYTIPDPFVRFWFGEVLPQRGLLATRGAAPVWEEVIRPRMGGHVSRLLPLAARTWLERDAAPLLGAVARETGGLWSGEHNLEVAGLLRNGAAVYGLCRWSEEPLGEAELDHLENGMRRSRYGIGREARHRLLFGRGGTTQALRSRAARDPMVQVVGVKELVGVR